MLIEDYEASSSTYEFADMFNMRRNTLRLAGFDLIDRPRRRGRGK
ncbi:MULTISPECIES: hypothetical protein [Actinomycetes]|nr:MULTISPECIES: hypothetical protein [Actinomycetes]